MKCNVYHGGQVSFTQEALIENIRAFMVRTTRDETDLLHCEGNRLFLAAVLNIRENGSLSAL
jgi:hypothetical protein